MLVKLVVLSEGSLEAIPYPPEKSRHANVGRRSCQSTG